MTNSNTVVTKCNPAQRKWRKVKKTFVKKKFSFQENFYWEKKEKVFFPRNLFSFPRKTFSSLFVIDATDHDSSVDEDNKIKLYF